MGKRKKAPLVVALPKPSGFYGVGIEWDDSFSSGGTGSDIDLQAVVVDEKGLIIDTVYYNNLSAANGSITHSGDQTCGAQSGMDESIWVQVGRVPEAVHLVIFVVCAFSEGAMLKDVDGGRIALMDGNMLNQLAAFKTEKSVANADVVGLMKRTKDGSWAFKEVDEPAEFGSHFLDIIEPCIGDIIRQEIPHAPSFQKVSFLTKKGAVASLPHTAKLRRVFVGVGGTLPFDTAADVDLDVSAVFCDSAGKIVGAVDGEQDSLHGVEHSGDSVADDGATGDDEAITVDLAQVPARVSRIFFVLTVPNGTFELLASAYVRISDQNASELARTDVQGGHYQHSGLIVAQLFRSQDTDQRWSFQATEHFVQRPKGKSPKLRHSWQIAQSEIERLARDADCDLHPAHNNRRRNTHKGGLHAVAEDDEAEEADAADLQAASEEQRKEEDAVEQNQDAQEETSPAAVEANCDLPTATTSANSDMAAPTRLVSEPSSVGSLSAPLRRQRPGSIQRSGSTVVPYTADEIPAMERSSTTSHGEISQGENSQPLGNRCIVDTNVLEGVDFLRTQTKNMGGGRLRLRSMTSMGVESQGLTKSTTSKASLDAQKARIIDPCESDVITFLAPDETDPADPPRACTCFCRR